MKYPIVNRDYYIIYLEFSFDMYWLHTDVFKWSKEIKKEYIKDLNTLQSLLDSPLYGMVDNDKLGKFGKTIGFTYLQDLTGNDGNTYQIYKRSL
jgi:hypothetical protein